MAPYGNSRNFDIGIIGAGILGTALAYFISSLISNNRSAGPGSHNSVILFEQEHSVGRHTSSRNTGKVHAPFLYDPTSKKLFARAALEGFEMIRNYCKLKNIPFKNDGVLEVATYDKGIDRLHQYLGWGFSNGLQENEVRFLDKSQVKKIEPNVRCLAAIHCLRDASVDYGLITQELANDARSSGCTILKSTRVISINNTRMGNLSSLEIHSSDDPYNNSGLADYQYHHPCESANEHGRTGGNKILVSTRSGDGEGRNETFSVGFLINAAGGNSLDIAHNLGIATEYSDLHFRGEYWQAPDLYSDLTKISIYSVPKFPDYPFLDPHWIVRVNGRKEVGPNAVPVFSPYAYSWNSNIRYLIPKIFESSSSVGLRKMIFDRQFLSLASNEIKSSLSKRAMINRAREFLPQLNPAHFTIRGTAGIRSSLIDRYGKFVKDTLILGDKQNQNSLHILNYNSPGATGALPISAMIVNRLAQRGIIKIVNATDMFIGSSTMSDIPFDLI